MSNGDSHKEVSPVGSVEDAMGTFRGSKQTQNYKTMRKPKQTYDQSKFIILKRKCIDLQKSNLNSFLFKSITKQLVIYHSAEYSCMAWRDVTWCDMHDVTRRDMT